MYFNKELHVFKTEIASGMVKAGEKIKYVDGAHTICLPVSM